MLGHRLSGLSDMFWQARACHEKRLLSRRCTDVLEERNQCRGVGALTHACGRWSSRPLHWRAETTSADVLI